MEGIIECVHEIDTENCTKYHNYQKIRIYYNADSLFGSSTLILNYILKYPVYQDIFLSRNFDFIVAIVAYYLKLCYNM